MFFNGTQASNQSNWLMKANRRDHLVYTFFFAENIVVATHECFSHRLCKCLVSDMDGLEDFNE